MHFTSLSAAFMVLSGSFILNMEVHRLAEQLVLTLWCHKPPIQFLKYVFTSLFKYQPPLLIHFHTNHLFCSINLLIKQLDASTNQSQSQLFCLFFFILASPCLCSPILSYQLRSKWQRMFHCHCRIFGGKLSVLGCWQNHSVYHHSSEKENTLWGLALSPIITHFLRERRLQI